MKRSLTFLFVFALPFLLSSQTWGPGTRWVYYQYEFFEDPHTNIIQIVADTVVNGLPAFALTGACYCGYASPFLHKEGQQVYFYEAGQFYLLYDFSLNAGDTLEIFSPQINCSGQPARFPIDSISYFQTLGGALLKVQHLGYIEDNCAYYFGNKIIENIGSDFCLYPQSGVCDPNTGPLLCFETQAGVYYPVPGVQCVSGAASGTENTGTTVRLYPNPTVVTDQFNVESSGAEIREINIYQPDGRQVYRQSLSALSGKVFWPEQAGSGIYIVEVLLANGQRTIHKIMR